MKHIYKTNPYTNWKLAAVRHDLHGCDNTKAETVKRIKLKLYRGKWKALNGKIFTTGELRMLSAMGYKFDLDARADRS